MAGLYKLYNIQGEVELKPFIEDEELEDGSIVVSIYILWWVGLRFPLDSIICGRLNELSILLGCCKPNKFRMLLGLIEVSVRFGALLNLHDIVYNLSTTCSGGMATLSLCPR